MSEVYINGKKRDGTKLLVQFYANHGRLNQVSEHTNVPVKELENWLKNDVISKDSKQKLDQSLEPNKKGKDLT